MPELSIGGGLGVAYVEGEDAPSITDWGSAIVSGCRDAGITARVTAEPGRSIVAQAAVTLYTVGTIKEVPGRAHLRVRRWRHVRQPAAGALRVGVRGVPARATDAARPKRVTIVGKHCESGDVLVRDAQVPDDLAVGDILATPVTGAYGHSMGSNYNKVLRPAVVFVQRGQGARGGAPGDL